MRDRDTNSVAAEPVEGTDGPTLRAFIQQHTDEGAQVYTDDHRTYMGLR